MLLTVNDNLPNSGSLHEVVILHCRYWSDHSLSQSGQAIYSLCPSTLAQWQYASQQQNFLLITKKEGSYEIIEHPTLLVCHIYSEHDTMVSGFRMQ